MPMRRIVPLLSFALVAATIGARPALSADGTAPTSTLHPLPGSHTAASTGNQAALRALGLLLSRQLAGFHLTDAELRSVLAGMADGVRHPADVKDAQTLVPQLQALERTRSEAEAQRQQRLGQKFLVKVAALPNAHKTNSGLVYVTLQEGTGPSPRIGDQIRVEYTGRLIDGSVFDASADHGGAVNFPLGHVIPCWDEALQLIKVGGRARVVCPPNLAYGDRGAGGLIGPGATLDFEVHLLSILPPAPPKVPAPPGAAGTMRMAPTPPIPPAPPTH